VSLSTVAPPQAPSTWSQKPYLGGGDEKRLPALGLDLSQPLRQDLDIHAPARIDRDPDQLLQTKPEDIGRPIH